jgi:hypothetical protein
VNHRFGGNHLDWFAPTSLAAPRCFEIEKWRSRHDSNTSTVSTWDSVSDQLTVVKRQRFRQQII